MKSCTWDEESLNPPSAPLRERFTLQEDATIGECVRKGTMRLIAGSVTMESLRKHGRFDQSFDRSLCCLIDLYLLVKFVRPVFYLNNVSLR